MKKFKIPEKATLIPQLPLYTIRGVKALILWVKNCENTAKLCGWITINAIHSVLTVKRCLKWEALWNCRMMLKMLFGGRILKNIYLPYPKIILAKSRFPIRLMQKNLFLRLMQVILKKIILTDNKKCFDSEWRQIRNS